MPNTLPPPLQQLATEVLSKWQKNAGEKPGCWFDSLQQQHAETVSRWQLAWAASPWLVEQCCKNPDWPQRLIEEQLLQANSSTGDFQLRLTAMAAPASVAELDRQLRQFRHFEQSRLIWRYFGGYADYGATVAETTLLAEVALDYALQWHYDKLCSELGVPCCEEGHRQRMVVLGLGKLGGAELNLSSDIDLIFCWPKSGQTSAAKHSKTISNHDFFERLGRKLINSLNATTREGFVFRIDMRLRPYGRDGALAINFDAMENYYEAQGRDWERYALCKLRPVAGDLAGGRQLCNRLKSFVYRRYLDFGALQSLRKISDSIKDKLSDSAQTEHIKLGKGGIRELEFIVQFFQLAYGGVHSALQHTGFLESLQALAEMKLIENPEQLTAAYIMLRNTEHVIQGIRDTQCHSLPDNESDRNALIAVMGYADYNSFLTVLNEKREIVHALFSKLRKEPKTAGEEEKTWTDFWQNRIDREACIQLLDRCGYSDPKTALLIIEDLHNHRLTRLMQPLARQRLDQFIPLLLNEIAKITDPDTVVKRIFPFVEQILRRSAYLALLNENPFVLQWLVKLFQQSAWLASQLCRWPANIDELMNQQGLLIKADSTALSTELNALTAPIKTDDKESLLNALRKFRAGKQICTAAQELDDVINAHTAARQLSQIAEVVLKKLYDICRQFWTADQHHPFGQFAIIAYGGLGSKEMNYGSDLDLVFLYEPAQSADADAPAADCASYFNQLARRIVHSITVTTMAGKLYDIDTRLRPAGQSGLLVSNFDAFASYLRHRAWTWEHQALIRARAIAGDEPLIKRFDSLRQEILASPRSAEQLRTDIVKMRDRIRTSKGNTSDLKIGEGGLIDAEFIVQYTVLRYAADIPELAQHTDMVSLLKIIGSQRLLPDEIVATVSDSWELYNTLSHRLWLGSVDTGSSAIQKRISAAMVRCREQVFGS